MRKRLASYLLFLLVTILLSAGYSTLSAPKGFAQGTCRTFPETGRTVCDRFLEYWQTHGGLPQQGYPISERLQEQSLSDGKVYTVQYFERAVFELHPENQPPYDVLLSLLGVFRLKEKYPNEAPDKNAEVLPSRIEFRETRKAIGGEFSIYWRTHGGLAQFGYPITYEFTEVSDLDGKEYTVQYFERAVFEKHPENPPESYVLLSQLGTFQYRGRYGQDNGSIPSLPAVTTVPQPPSPMPTLALSKLLQRSHLTEPPARPTATNPAPGGIGGTINSPTGPNRDCGDFYSQALSLCLYEAAGGPARDPHGLGGNHDGIACESLP